MLGMTTVTLANFTLDGTTPELFQHTPDPIWMDTGIDYNQLVYSKHDLLNAEHTLVISTSDENYTVYVNFDYAIYMWVWNFCTPIVLTMFSGHDDDAPLLPLPGSSEVTVPNTSNTKNSPPVGPTVGLCSLYRLFSSYCFAGGDSLTTLWIRSSSFVAVSGCPVAFK